MSEVARLADEAARLPADEAPEDARLRAPPDAARLRELPDAARLREPPDDACAEVFEARGLEPELFFAAERVDPEEDLLRLLPPLVVAI